MRKRVERPGATSKQQPELERQIKIVIPFTESKHQIKQTQYNTNYKQNNN